MSNKMTREEYWAARKRLLAHTIEDICDITNTLDEFYKGEEKPKRTFHVLTDLMCEGGYFTRNSLMVFRSKDGNYICDDGRDYVLSGEIVETSPALFREVE